VLARIKRFLRPTAQQTVDNLVGSLYVREEDFRTAIDDLRRVLDDRITGTSEVNTILGQRLNELEAMVAELRDEVRSLRSTVT